MSPAQSTPKPKSRPATQATGDASVCTCAQCGCNYPVEFAKLHRDDRVLCDYLGELLKEACSEDDYLPVKSVHPFFFTRFGGCLRFVPSSVLDSKDLPTLPKRYNHCLLFDSDLMVLCGINAGQPLWFWIDGCCDGQLGIAWPAGSLVVGKFRVAIVENDNHVGKAKTLKTKKKGKPTLDSSSSGSSEFLIYQRFQNAPVLAELVRMESIDTGNLNWKINAGEWECYCRNKFSGSFMNQGQILNVRYFGRIFRVRVHLEGTQSDEESPAYPLLNGPGAFNEYGAINASMDSLSVKDPSSFLDQTPSSIVLAGMMQNSSVDFAVHGIPECQSPLNRTFDKSFTQIETFIRVSRDIKAEREIIAFLCSDRTSYLLEIGRSNDSTNLIEKEGQAKPMASEISFEYVGGMQATKSTLRRHLIDAMICFDSTSLSVSGAIVLIFGSPGSGKSFLCKAIAGELLRSAQKSHPGINFPIYCFSTDVVSSVGGNINECVTLLKSMTAAVLSAGRGMLLIDDVDILVRKEFWPSTAGGASEAAYRFASTLESSMDLIEDQDGVCVSLVAMATERDKLPSRLRRKFELELDLPVPNADDRCDILGKLMAQSKGSFDVGNNSALHLTPSQMATVADNSPGFTAGDLKALVKSARRLIAGRLMDNDRELDLCTAFLDAGQLIRPSAVRDVLLEIPRTSWDEIGGQDEIKRRLKEVVELPLKFPEIFIKMGIQPSTGVLLYGPPGCSKTMIAKAIAAESRLNFLSVKGPELFNKWVGESERGVREIFRKARAAAPSVIFFDEIDVMAASRTSVGGSGEGGSNVGDRVLAQLLTELDGIVPRNQVIVLAATNRPDTIDPALLRPGRMDRLIYVPLPDSDTRRRIFDISFRKIPNLNLDQWLEPLISCTNGYSGAELVSLCHEAAMNRIKVELGRDGCSPGDLELRGVDWSDFEAALTIIKPGTTEKQLQILEDFSSKSR